MNHESICIIISYTGFISFQNCRIENLGMAMSVAPQRQIPSPWTRPKGAGSPYRWYPGAP